MDVTECMWMCLNFFIFFLGDKEWFLYQIISKKSKTVSRFRLKLRLRLRVQSRHSRVSAAFYIWYLLTVTSLWPTASHTHHILQERLCRMSQNKQDAQIPCLRTKVSKRCASLALVALRQILQTHQPPPAKINSSCFLCHPVFSPSCKIKLFSVWI